MEQLVPVFGVRNESLPQKTRSCAYAVVTNSEGLVAAVREDGGKLHLPGGGIELAETPPQALHREVREELGYQVQLTGRIGGALQYFSSDGHCTAMYAEFYSGELGQKVQDTYEHQLEWTPPGALHHPCQAWAAQKHLNELVAAEAK
jgi:8-oxo-dGTP diphosphatase